MSSENWIELRRHPSTPGVTVREIHVLVRRSARAEVEMTYRVEGDTNRVRIPSPAVPRIAEELWRRTCFEAFIALEGQAGYHEFNFAPSGEWAIYAFCGYREGARLLNQINGPEIAVRSDGSRFEIGALVRLADLSAIHRHASLRMGLSAVIEDDDGISYWALHHPTGKPDFHHADGFTLLLEPPSGER